MRSHTLRFFPVGTARAITLVVVLTVPAAAQFTTSFEGYINDLTGIRSGL
jgi:hypothetical protein